MKKIVGIGNALVDILLHIDNDDLLEKNGLDKGGMVMIDAENKAELDKSISRMEKWCATGGSTSNTIHGIARLGATAGYIGKVGRDEMGDLFCREMKRFGVTPHTIASDTSTVLPPRSSPQMRNGPLLHTQAAATMQPEEIDPAVIAQYDYILVEGYLIFNHDLILRVCRTAKEHGLRIAMDMASYNIIEANLDFVEGLLRDYVDIIFANEEEAKAFTGKEGREALDKLAEYCSVAVVKVGKEGSLVKMDGETTVIAPVDAVRRDTTGAGDIYAAGFLYGLMNGYTARRAGDLASFLSARMIEHIGAKLPDEVWEEARKML